ncbi:MAG TPA: HNH endonuclease signature motif containing protein [Abditibacterium sp.]|jgi:hypothetical protein
MNSSQNSLRRSYIEKLSPEIVERACRKANWHKARAQKLKRTEHFTAYQWLDLCEARGWQCAYCRRKMLLEPHHRLELHKGGANSIDNIEPLCYDCHRAVHEWPDDVSDAWMSFQAELLRHFEVVAAEMGQVRLSHGTREENQRRGRGILLELFPAQRGAAPLRGQLARQTEPPREPFVPRNELNHDWWENRAAARVKWIFPREWEETLFLAHLTGAQEKIEMFDPLPLPLMELPRKNRRGRLQSSQMSFDFSF